MPRTRGDGPVHARMQLGLSFLFPFSGHHAHVVSGVWPRARAVVGFDSREVAPPLPHHCGQRGELPREGRGAPSAGQERRKNRCVTRFWRLDERVFDQ